MPFNLPLGPIIAATTVCHSDAISNNSGRKSQHLRHSQSKQLQPLFSKSTKLRYRWMLSHKKWHSLTRPNSARNTLDLRSHEIRTKSLHIWRRIKLLRCSRLPLLTRTHLNNTSTLTLIVFYNVRSEQWTQSSILKQMILKRNQSHLEYQPNKIAASRSIWRSDAPSDISRHQPRRPLIKIKTKCNKKKLNSLSNLKCHIVH